MDFFTTRSWNFPNDNSILLQNEMNDTDQKVSYGFRDIGKETSYIDSYGILR